MFKLGSRIKDGGARQSLVLTERNGRNVLRESDKVNRDKYIKEAKP